MTAQRYRDLARAALAKADARTNYEKSPEAAAEADERNEKSSDSDAEANGWRRNPDGPGWIETEERARRCVFNDGPLADGNPALCVACYARILGKDEDQP